MPNLVDNTVYEKMTENQNEQKTNYDKNAKIDKIAFSVREKVWVQDVLRKVWEGEIILETTEAAKIIFCKY